VRLGSSLQCLGIQHPQANWHQAHDAWGEESTEQGRNFHHNKSKGQPLLAEAIDDGRARLRAFTPPTCGCSPSSLILGPLLLLVLLVLALVAHGCAQRREPIHGCCKVMHKQRWADAWGNNGMLQLRTSPASAWHADQLNTVVKRESLSRTSKRTLSRAKAQASVPCLLERSAKRID